MVLLGWGGVLFGSFQYDDFPNILTDPATAGGAALLERLVTGVRPLTRLSYALDHVLWGRWAGGWLLTNFLLHGVTTYAVYRLALARGASTALASWAAILFALQPAHGMTVAYVSGRSAGLMTALLVEALVAFEAYNDGRKQWHLLLSLLLFVLACAAKEVAVVFPALLLLWTLTRSEVSGSKRLELEAIAPFVLLAVMGAVVAFTNSRYRGLLEFSLNLRSPWESLVHNASALPVTLSLLLRPWSLAVEHATLAGSYLTIAGPMVMLAWAGVAIGLWRKHLWVALGMLWPVIALLPAHSLIAKADAVSETSLYLAWVGPSIALAMASRRLRASDSHRTAAGFVGILLAATCIWRTVIWSNPVRLWREAAAEAPMSARAWNNLGLAYMAKAHSKEAKHAFETVLKLDPGNARAIRNLDLLELVN